MFQRQQPRAAPSQLGWANLAGKSQRLRAKRNQLTSPSPPLFPHFVMQTLSQAFAELVPKPEVGAMAAELGKHKDGKGVDSGGLPVPPTVAIDLSACQVRAFIKRANAGSQ